MSASLDRRGPVSTIGSSSHHGAPSPKLVPGSPVAYDFALAIPVTAAPSHDTTDTTITWLVVGTIDRPWRGDYTVTQWVSVYNG